MATRCIGKLFFRRKQLIDNFKKEKKVCDLLHLREMSPGIWLSKTQYGNYAVCEDSDGSACVGTTVCSCLEDAENYAAYCVDPASPGGWRWITKENKR